MFVPQFPNLLHVGDNDFQLMKIKRTNYWTYIENGLADRQVFFLLNIDF